MIKAHGRRRRGGDGSFVEDLLKDAGRSVVGGAVDRLEDGARGAFDWTLRRLFGTLLALAVLVSAVVLLLISGIEGLREASLPPSLAHLLVGLAGLGVGLVLYRLKEPSRR